MDMNHKILVTLGPSSMQQDIIGEMEKENVYLFRINLSHTPAELIEDVISEVQSYTKVPVCIDSEGAQVRNHKMQDGQVFLKKSDVVKIHFDEVLGDSNNISFSPNYVAKQLRIDDELRIDFNSASIKVFEKNKDHCLAKVIVEGKIGSNKATDLNRELEMEAITPKDRKAIAIGRKMGIKNYSLSFAGSKEDIKLLRELAGTDINVISKIESKKGLCNLNDILHESDEILIDRGDLSRQVDIVKIPFFQRRIISMARSKRVPVNVATNLLESMITFHIPTRAEVNDVVSTLLDGANGLVLAAETAIGRYPVETVRIVRQLISQVERWTPNTSIKELLEGE